MDSRENRRNGKISIDGSWRRIWGSRGYFNRYSYSAFDYDENVLKEKNLIILKIKIIS